MNHESHYLIGREMTMVDIETTGLDPEENNITSIALVRFIIQYHAEYGLVGHIISQDTVAYHKLKLRIDNAGTLEWREDNGVDEAEGHIDIVDFQSDENQRILQKMTKVSDAEDIKKKYTSCPIIARNPEFDVAFLKSYWRDCSRVREEGCELLSTDFPFHYRQVRDLTSLINGLGFVERYEDRPEGYDEHTALGDCHMAIHQLVMMVAKRFHMYYKFKAVPNSVF